jgi:hypothetical protein
MLVKSCVSTTPQNNYWTLFVGTVQLATQKHLMTIGLRTLDSLHFCYGECWNMALYLVFIQAFAFDCVFGRCF